MDGRTDGRIDFVIAWVDGSDPEWRAQKARYAPQDGAGRGADGEARYRDWDLLRYWLRGAERFAPWVGTIHFVTCGHLPAWLNTAHPKLHIVRHEDFIPAEYLPTFSSHTIELNLHRIPGLAERFVYFNDDMFLTAPVRETDFFRRGLPCDAAILYPVHMVDNGIRAEINDLYAINRHFHKNDVIRKHPLKWLHPCYGRMLARTLCMMPFTRFSGFYVHHLPCAYLKRTFLEVWDAEGDALGETCRHRFRDVRDVNQWVMQYWQYASGRFMPRTPDIGTMEEGQEGLLRLAGEIERQRYKMVCCNDSPEIADFDGVKARLQAAFARILPEPSAYELG